ncbi:MAG: zinc ABC transporter permease [Gammaproteobacteria bacterium]|jgi:zinc/manganese transport system permease protein|nr:zinc ABC transporter permease [Gammaproteobacteria bacterium]
MGLDLLLLEPFAEFEFMRRALVACLALSVGCGPVGTLLVLRRMSLVGDALSHAVLPGAAIGFMVAGLSLVAMSLGGFIAGISVALLSGLAARMTLQNEDASFAAFYLISLSLGVLIVTTHGSSVDLMHVLFGSILAVDDASLLLIVAIATLTLFILALIGRALIVECFDPGFMRAVGGPGTMVHLAFLVLVVMNLVAGFHALGTLMAVGLMMLPAAAARFWAGGVGTLAVASTAIAFGSAYVGLLLSYHADLPTGPAVILVAGGVYCASLVMGPRGSLMTQFVRRRHLVA